MAGHRRVTTMVVARVAVVAIGVIGAWVAAPAAASAASRYAAPTAQGSGDCSTTANACPLGTAVSGAASGDNIYVLGNLGSYTLGSGNVKPGSSKTLHFIGINGRPTLTGNDFSYVMILTAPSSSVENLALETGGISVAPISGTINVDRVFATSTATSGSQACYFGGGVTLTNSVCWSDGNYPGGPVLETDGTNTLRNDVVWGTGTIAYGIRNFGRASENGDDILINTIVRDTHPGSADLYAQSDGTRTATFDVRNSNFATTLAGGAAALDHFNTNSTDQSAAPRLVAPSSGNFHELAGSPTINAGVTSSANGPLDLDGGPRTVNGKTDIGAYELGTKLTPPHKPRISGAKINRRKRSATFRFTAAGKVTGFQCALIKPRKGKHRKKPKVVFSACRSPKTYKHLRHGRYTFEVRAFNSAGVDSTPVIRKFKI